LWCAVSARASDWFDPAADIPEIVSVGIELQKLPLGFDLRGVLRNNRIIGDQSCDFIQFGSVAACNGDAGACLRQGFLRWRGLYPNCRP
jgi:hypothetical protein